MRIVSIVCILASLAVVPAFAGGQQASDESLGDLARQVRQQRGKAPKAVKTFTNDDMPAPPRGIGAAHTPAADTEKSAEGEKTQETAAKPTSAEAEKKTGAEPATSEDKVVKDRAYWQAKFKEARRLLARAKEEQQLTEDELNLLQIQQAREVNSISREDLNARIDDKQSELDTKRDATDDARKALETLEQEFKDGGAPEDWSATD